QPEDLPEPENDLIVIDGEGKSEQKVFMEAILHTYDVRRDDSRLRASVDTFEKQRGSYPLRREFCAYTIDLRNGTPEMLRKLKAMGFLLRN
ncbi:MAG TPA: DUF3410 domain-containing protein, partial [Bacteroidales bacterium]|nr:DUF3410 domain-containing protein [Bacteroidales bacterium]